MIIVGTTRSNSTGRSPRRGWTLTESLMAFTVLSLAMVVAVQLLASIIDQRRHQQRRLAAELEAANVVERILAMPWDALSTEQLAAAKEPWQKQLTEVVGDAELRCDVQSDEGPPAAKRITVEIVSLGASDQFPMLARLVTWTYPLSE